MSARASRWRLLVLLLGGAAGGDPAMAHGPCGCLDPRVVEPGAQVRVAGPGGVGYPAYRVIFNPQRGDLGIGPADLDGAFRADAPSRTVFSRPRLSPTRRARFRVPRDAPPGLYLVLIFDGDEGGSHNTWEYLHVIDADGPAPEPVVGAQAPRSRAPETDDAEDPAPDWLLIALAAAAGTGVGFLSATMRHRAAR